MQHLLRDSAELEEKLGLLQEKNDLLDSVFGKERSESFQSELSGAVRNRELLHSQLLQRKSRLQVQHKNLAALKLRILVLCKVMLRSL